MLNSSPLNDTTFINKIVYIEKLNDYTTLFMKDNEQVILHDSLKKLTNKLPTNMFFRTHKSYIVNLSEVVEFVNKDSKMFAYLSNKKTIPVSRRKRKELMSRIFIIS